LILFFFYKKTIAQPETIYLGHSGSVTSRIDSYIAKTIIEEIFGQKAELVEIIDRYIVDAFRNGTLHTYLEFWEAYKPINQEFLESPEIGYGIYHFISL